MPAYTYDRFDAGLDLRKGASVADANRLRQLKNAYVTTGRVLAKRPGLTLVATLEAGTKGLVSGNGKLNTFYESGTITHANTLFVANKVAHPTLSQSVKKVCGATVFDGYLYAAIQYNDDSVWHHYLDGGSPTHVVDVNCPHNVVMLKMAEKIWSPSSDAVRFSATALPRNWTLTDDAGFLPTGRQQSNGGSVTALGIRDRDMVCFYETNAQLWVVDPDPALHVYKKPINGVGTTYNRSIANVSDDCFFLSKQGYRSISLASQSDNLTDVDVGSPIDSIVTPLLVDGIEPVAVFSSMTGQYINAIGSTVHAYTFSRSNKISAWSLYEFGISIDDLAELNGVLYLRDGDNVYKLDKTVYTDNGVNYSMEIELPYLDMKKAGVLKQFIGMDMVVQGSVDVQFRWDPNNPNNITSPFTVSGDTHISAMIPMEMSATQIAPVFTSTSGEYVQIDSLTFYYEELGTL